MSNHCENTVCFECGGQVVPVAKAGRTVRWHGETYDVPADLTIRTCSSCGTEWTTEVEDQAIDEACRAQRAARMSPQPASVVLGPWPGRYTQRRAAELVVVPQSTLNRWVSGYWLPGGRRGDPILLRGDKGGLSFLDVAELAVLGSFRRAGVYLTNLRVAAQTACEFFSVESHPFCTQKLLTDGNRVFARIAAVSEGDNKRLVDLVSRNMVIKEVLAPILDQFDFDIQASLPCRWWPAGKDKRIVIDPAHEHGEPVILGTGVQTKLLCLDADKGDSPSELADCYGLSVNDVEEAIAYERGLQSRLK